MATKHDSSSTSDDAEAQLLETARYLDADTALRKQLPPLDGKRVYTPALSIETIAAVDAQRVRAEKLGLSTEVLDAAYALAWERFGVEFFKELDRLINIAVHAPEPLRLEMINGLETKLSLIKSAFS